MATLAVGERSAHQPGLRQRLTGLPPWAGAGALLVVLLAVSAYLRTRQLGAAFWMDEGLSVGIASHPLSAIPAVLRHDGSPPLYYLLLHIWMGLFGTSESVTHALSLLFALATIPAGMWAGWSLWGRRAGYLAAILFAFSAFLDQYAQETRMYAMMAFFGLIATAAYLHAFVRRRRRYLGLLAVMQAAMLYTHAWGIFFGAAAVVALVPLWLASEDRRGVGRDGLLAFGGAAVLFAPWLPTFLFQAAHTAAPWDLRPGLGVPRQVAHNLLGGYGETLALAVATVVGLWPLARRRARRTPPALMAWALLAIPVVGLALAWLASQITPAWDPRYFAPFLAPLLLLAAFGAARARALGLVAILASIALVANPAAFAPAHKSDVRLISADLASRLHRGDLVIVTEPEQAPLAWYYLPRGLRYATTLGPVSDPRYMNWVDALDRFRATDWSSVERSLLHEVAPGQQILFLRPLTVGEYNWESNWGEIIRRRSAQWGEVMASDPQLMPVAWAPRRLPNDCCIADSAVLYRKAR